MLSNLAIVLLFTGRIGVIDDGCRWPSMLAESCQMSGEASVVAADASQTRRAAAAARMRRSRRRRSKGMRCCTLEIRDEEIAELVSRGLLADGDRTSRRAITKAMYAFLDNTLGRPRDAQQARW